MSDLFGLKNLIVIFIMILFKLHFNHRFFTSATECNPILKQTVNHKLFFWFTTGSSYALFSYFMRFRNPLLKPGLLSISYCILDFKVRHKKEKKISILSRPIASLYTIASPMYNRKYSAGQV